MNASAEEQTVCCYVGDGNRNGRGDMIAGSLNAQRINYRLFVVAAPVFETIAKPNENL